MADKRRVFSIVALLAFFGGVSALPAPSEPGSDPERTIGGKLSGDVRLSGRVRVTEDLVVLPGATLTVARGTTVVFDKSESSKVEPEFFYGGVELIVRGTIRASGAAFRFPGRTGGIVVDGGRAEFSDVAVSGAEAGISLQRSGTVSADGPVTVSDCRVGVALFPGDGGGWKGGGTVILEKNGVGAARFPGAHFPPPTFHPRDNEETDFLSWGGGAQGSDPGPQARLSPNAGALRIGDTFLDRNRTLSGDVIVDGVLRVAPGATLTVEPGTRIFFAFRDTDGDGIGESGIFLQGNLRARGTKEKPIGFYPLDGDGWGRWDAINFMVSDRGENVLENVEIAGAYRGLHAHFSRLRGSAIRISGCYRGIQFQESEVELSRVDVVSSNSALRCRDSDVKLSHFRVRDTVSGANFFRSRVTLVSPEISRPGWYGFRFRESKIYMSKGSVSKGMIGVSVQDGTVSMDGSSLESGGLAGAALQEGDVKMKDCRISGIALDAISATSAAVSVSGGSMAGFGRYAVKLGGPAEVRLRGVEIAGKGPGGNPFLDGNVMPGLGVVRVE